MSGGDLLFQLLVELFGWLFGTQLFQFGMHLLSQASDLVICISAKIIAFTNPGVDPASLDPLYIMGVFAGVTLLLLGVLAPMAFWLNKVHSRLEKS